MRESKMVPRKAFLTKGVAVDREKLGSFEMALRDAGIAQFNLVRVSSIFPPFCKLVSKEEGGKELSAGQILHVVLTDTSTNEPNRLICSSVGLAIPADRSKFGYLSEHHAYGQTDRKAGDYSEDLAASMLATTLGIPFDKNVHYDARREIWKFRKEIVITRNITQSALGNKDGLWTTVVAACILIL